MSRSALAITVGLLGALGLATPSSAAVPQDVVTGEGVIGPTSLNHFAFDAHSGPAGEDAHGNAHVFDNTTVDGTPMRRFDGPVTCLRVSGRLATFVVDFRTVRNRPFDGALFVVEDNGNPAGPTSPDRIGIRDFTGPPPPCPDPLAVAPPNGVLERGDIDVRDATA